MRYSTLLPAAAIITAMALPAATVFAQDAKPSAATKEFVDQAAISDMYEVQAGKLAETKGSSAGVKSFGRHMVTATPKPRQI